MIIAAVANVIVNVVVVAIVLGFVVVVVVVVVVPVVVVQGVGVVLFFCVSAYVCVRLFV